MLIVEWIVFGSIPGFLINTYYSHIRKMVKVNVINKSNTNKNGN